MLEQYPMIYFLLHFLSLESYWRFKMQEALLHYIWGQSLLEDTEYIADTGEKIKIIEPGKQNHDGGPDFTNAKIRIDGTLWAGNVEIHIKSSDWQNHGHQNDAAYDNVILHIAENFDNKCFSHSQRRIPTIRLNFSREIEYKYNKLVNSLGLISCSDSLAGLDRSLLSFWYSALAIERLYSKTRIIMNTLSKSGNSWEDAFYIHLARGFGLKINSVPFELMAKSTPLKILLKLSNNLTRLEALLFGQAGFLNCKPVDSYQALLQTEYKFLRNKYRLKNIEVHLWKFLRLRPYNFPTIRLAEFSSLLYNSRNLFSVMLECQNLNQVYEILRYQVSDYWKIHYTFGKESKKKEKFVGPQTIDSIIINVIIPFMFIYGGQKNNEELKDRSVRLLEEIAPENNNIIRKWKTFNIVARHAADSQALLQLTLEYCTKKRCLDCQIGNLILRKIQA
jgi:hypothetical protein